MLIQNTTASAPGFTSDSAPVAVAAPETRSAPRIAVKAVPEQPTAPPTAAQLKSAVDSINKAMRQANANVEFSIDQETQKTVVKVVESKTGEVLRQYPSEEVLAISRAIDNNMQQGLLIKQQA